MLGLASQHLGPVPVGLAAAVRQPDASLLRSLAVRRPVQRPPTRQRLLEALRNCPHRVVQPARREPVGVSQLSAQIVEKPLCSAQGLAANPLIGEYGRGLVQQLQRRLLALA